MSEVSGLLAVIDMQRVFAEPDSPWAAPRFAEAAAGVRRLLPAFGDRVVFTRFLAPDEPAGAWRDYYARWPFALQPPHAPLWRLTDEFASVARHVVDATTFGKWTPRLAELAGPAGRLVLAGVSTDCCVLSTALAAADAGVEVLVAADACAGADDDAHARALHLLDLYRPLVRVTTVGELLREPPAPDRPRAIGHRPGE
ncbi:hydrolase [Streptomyces sp. Ru71]|uniref:cysteine hydrolase family protein n=1 Tax=Streptomyces sp. Ru71 TaxID=2080746 RepID=UPI000CDDEB5E|nr:isochorismatase family protein [Streptomyces sp. Ru71]POX46478.1 hydrolase [Streptomyces sp. Ru71]